MILFMADYTSAHVSPPGAADADHAAAVDKSMEAK